MTQPRAVPGMFTLVLHTHLPWLAHHGRWPVGEEWLYQSWAASYLPLLRVLRRLADEDRHRLITLGVTPVVTAQLDDPYCLDGMHHWLANWQLRAAEAASFPPGDALRAFGIREFAESQQALDDFTTHWRHGASPLLRNLIDAGTVELLGGPLAHPFQPLLTPRLREFALREGLADARQRLAHKLTGIWAPECAYAPGMEHDYAAAGVGHFMVDGPSLRGDTALGRPVGDSSVVAFGREPDLHLRLEVRIVDKIGGELPREEHALRRIPSEDSSPRALGPVDGTFEPTSPDPWLRHDLGAW